MFVSSKSADGHCKGMKPRPAVALCVALALALLTGAALLCRRHRRLHAEAGAGRPVTRGSYVVVLQGASGQGADEAARRLEGLAGSRGVLVPGADPLSAGSRSGLVRPCEDLPRYLRERLAPGTPVLLVTPASHASPALCASPPRPPQGTLYSHAVDVRPLALHNTAGRPARPRLGDPALPLRCVAGEPGASGADTLLDRRFIVGQARDIAALLPLVPFHDKDAYDVALTPRGSAGRGCGRGPPLFPRRRGVVASPGDLCGPTESPDRLVIGAISVGRMDREAGHALLTAAGREDRSSNQT